MRPNISDVGHPNRIRGADVEVLLQSISCYDSRLGAILAGAAFITDLRPQTFVPHQLSNRVRRAGFAKAEQIMVDLG